MTTIVDEALVPQAELIRAQVETGHHIIRRARNFAERIASAQAGFAKELLKLADHEKAKLDSWKAPDGLSSVWKLLLYVE